VILFIFDPTDRHPTDEVIELLKSINKPIILVVNKMDSSDPERAKQKPAAIENLLRLYSVHYVSATRGDGIEELMESIRSVMMPGPPFYPKEDLSEHPLRFFVSELIREQHGDIV
jgi:GTPase